MFLLGGLPIGGLSPRGSAYRGLPPGGLSPGGLPMGICLQRGLPTEGLGNTLPPEPEKRVVGILLDCCLVDIVKFDLD